MVGLAGGRTWDETGGSSGFYLTAEFGGKLWALFQTRCLEIPSVKEALLHLSRRETYVVIFAYRPGRKLFYKELARAGRKGVVDFKVVEEANCHHR